ncbi:MAG: ABC transporter permease, partial [Opitutaceae bacterium]
TESLVLAALGAALSTCFAIWGLDLLSAVSVGEDAPPLNERVIGFTTVVAVLASMGFGLMPALRATRLDLNAEFQGGRGKLGGGPSRLGRALLIVQVALSLVLLVGAGLFIRTVSNLRAVNVGFDRSRLVLFSIDASWTGYSPAQANALNDRVGERIAGLPGIDGVTFAGWSILSNMGGFEIGVSIPGYSPPPGERTTVKLAPVAVNYFQTYRIAVLAGRAFEPRDGATAQKVAVINRAFARKYFGEENPLGKTIRQGRDEREVVGLVTDVKQEDLRVPAAPVLFVPLVQSGNGPRTRATFFTVRTAGEPAPMIGAIRHAVREVDSNLPVINLRTQDEVVERRLLSSERLFARMSVCLGLLALALACVGLYGLMSYAVHRRTGEIGVRMALGALPRTVLAMILRESLGLVLLGVGLGLAAAAGATRLVGHLLYGLSPMDAPTYAAVALVLIVVASVAALLPARRAAKVDPVVALRSE